MIELYPMLLKPCYKNYLWGGSRLKGEFGKLDAPTPTAESWELVSREDEKSTIANGPLKGKTLEDLRQIDTLAYWGTHCQQERFPLLIKLIDAKHDLSIQVHPSEESALMDVGEQGKAEMWYVVDCVPHAHIYYGLSRQIDEEEFVARVNDGSICEILNQVPVERGDVFYILPGVIHAIGSGIVIAEIQQNSDTTFRIYDYLRRDTQGNERPLHLQRAKSVIDYKPIVPTECKFNSGAKFDGFSMSEMFSCRYFHAYRFDILSRVQLHSDQKSFQHILFVEGHGVIRSQDLEIPYRKGDSFFIPAALGGYVVEGNSRMLLSHV